MFSSVQTTAPAADTVPEGHGCRHKRDDKSRQNLNRWQVAIPFASTLHVQTPCTRLRCLYARATPSCHRHPCSLTYLAHIKIALVREHACRAWLALRVPRGSGFACNVGAGKAVAFLHTLAGAGHGCHGPDLAARAPFQAATVLHNRKERQRCEAFIRRMVR